MDRLDRPSARRIAAAAILLGVVMELALDGPAYGINILLVVGLTLATAWLVRRRDRALDPLDAWLPGTALTLAALVAVRGDEFLAGLDIAWSFLFCGAALVALSGIAVTRRSASVIAAMGAWAAEGALVGGARVLGAARPERTTTPVDDRTLTHLGAVGRGLVVGLPLATIFIVLFASADPIFRARLSDLVGFRIDLGDVPGRVAFTLAAAWLAAGALSVAARGIPDVVHASLGAAAWTPVSSGRRSLHRSLGVPEALIILGCIDLVIGLFVGLQVAYLFGGLDTLAAAGITYADYARRGFFELVAAACLAAAVVVVLEHAVRQRSRSYLAALLVLVGLTAAVLVSAALRLRLYQDAYGWTELRLYVFVAIATMGVGLVTMAGLIVLDRSRWLGHGLAMIGVVSLVGLNILSPGAFVAERNIERVLTPSIVPADGHPGLDADYLAVLPDDAIPTMVAALPNLPATEAGMVRSILVARRTQLRTDEAYESPLSWNLGRERARQALETIP